jgi:hypothetical protein
MIHRGSLVGVAWAAYLLCAVACSHDQLHPGAQTSGAGVIEEVAVTGPVIVAVVPSDTRERLATEANLGEHLAHIEFALADVKKCLSPQDARVVVLPAETVIFIQDGRRLQVYPDPSTQARDARGEAVVFGKPGSLPRTVLRKDNIIHPMVLGEAASYFGAPSCDPMAYYSR